MNFSAAVLKEISIHYIGNKANYESLILSDAPLEVDVDIAVRLKDYFSDKFGKIYDRYRFTHPNSLQYNEMYNYAGEIFTDFSPFHEVSCQIARHLHEQTAHPQIKSGELYVCLFENVLYEQKYMRALGIFKTENKAGFLESGHQGNQFELAYKEGVDLQKMDKGCLIFQTDFENGFELCIVDQVSRGEEAQYWKEDFLRLEKISNEYHQTSQLLSMTKNYVTQQLSEDIAVSKTDQLDLLNRTAEYFKTRETYDQLEFEEQVLKEDTIIESFRSYGETYAEMNDVRFETSFDISEQAVKKQSRMFKSVLKLDKNFHVYIHGDRNLIEQGVDENGRKFYKIYYEKEE